MPDNKTQCSEIQDPIRQFLACACEGDIDAICTLVKAGFDLTGVDRHGDTILEVIIRELEFSANAPKYEVVKEVLRLGANARQLNSDGSGPLFAAVLNMDTEMLRILLDAGADPNAEKMDSDVESLYDWAEFDYRYEVWNFNRPEDATDDDRVNEDTWLRYLDRLAVKYAKRRPDHLQLLRQRGALSMAELRQRAGKNNSQGISEHKE